MTANGKVLRPPAEVEYAEELRLLAETDSDPRPPGWKLSPRAVKAFICGSDNPKVPRKFYGDDILVERAIIGLAGNRGLLLVGEPGTAKTMLSELLAAHIADEKGRVVVVTGGFHTVALPQTKPKRPKKTNLARTTPRLR